MNRLLKRSSADPPAGPISGQAATVSPRGKLKRIGLKLTTTLISTLVMIAVLLGADLYLHHKHGVNLWGYRGASAGQKQPGEKRLAVLGGSTTWGFGLRAGQDFPAQLQQMLAAPAGDRPSASIKVLNLGYNNEGAYSFSYTLRDYDYLDYDAVVLYSGYNDLGVENRMVFRHRSPIFVWTGYLPLLPALTADKISEWKNRSRKRNQPVVFTPPANESETREQTSKSLQTTLGQLTDSSGASLGPADGTCPARWKFYCQEIFAVSEHELQRGKRVLVVTEPYISDSHVEQQRALEAMLNQRFAGQAHFRYLNLGPAIDLRDRSLCWDGMHLTAEGNRRIAAALMEPVLDLLQR